MKRTLIVVGVVLLILVAVALWVFYKGLPSSASKAAPVPGASGYVRPTSTSPGAGTPRPGQATALPVLSPTATPAPVAFSLNVSQTAAPESNFGLFGGKVTVHLHAPLANSGDKDAHNVSVTTRARVGNTYVPIDGKDAFLVSVGTVGAHSTVAKDLSFTMDMTLSQGQSAQSNGIFFEITIVADEGTSYIPLMRCTETECAPA